MRRTAARPVTLRPVIVRPTLAFLAAFALAAASTAGTAAARNPPRTGSGDRYAVDGSISQTADDAYTIGQP